MKYKVSNIRSAGVFDVLAIAEPEELTAILVDFIEDSERGNTQVALYIEKASAKDIVDNIKEETKLRKEKQES